MIDGVGIRPLNRFADERGEVLHMLRRDWPEFEAFGEIYFSTVNPGKIKGWHRHSRVTNNYAVPVGRIRLVLIDGRSGDPKTGAMQDLSVGGAVDYNLITIPPGVWYAFQALDDELALVANCASESHDPDEGEKRALDDPAFPLVWA